MQNMSFSAGLCASIALEKYGFRTSHSLGQNFILDDSFLNHLLDLAQIGEDDCILEIGPGPGVMTALLAERSKKVLAVEMDEKLRPVLQDVLSGIDNAEILFVDAMKVDLGKIAAERLGEHYRVVANLPYYITADLIQKMALSRPQPESICVMVQKEAAERLMSETGAKNWCAFAAIMRFFGDTEILEEVPADVFNPPPHVESCFIKIGMHKERIVPQEEEDDLIRLIRCCFAMRRKTLSNNLKSYYGMKQDRAAAVIEAAGLPAQVRGEALTLEEIASLMHAIKDMN